MSELRSSDQLLDARAKIAAALYRLHQIKPNKPMQVSIEVQEIDALLTEAFALIPVPIDPPYIRTGATA